MAAQAMQRRFNPKEYHKDASDLMKRNPELAADAMTKLARRMNQAEGELSEGQELTLSIVSGLFASAVMLGIGFWNGDNEERAKALIEDWEMSGAAAVGADLEQYPEPWDHPEGIKDPRKILKFIPKTLVSTAGFIVGAIAVGAATKNTDNVLYRILRDAAFLNFGYFLAKVGEGAGENRARKKMEEEANTEAAA